MGVRNAAHLYLFVSLYGVHTGGERGGGGKSLVMAAESKYRLHIVSTPGLSLGLRHNRK